MLIQSMPYHGEMEEFSRLHDDMATGDLDGLHGDISFTQLLQVSNEF